MSLNVAPGLYVLRYLNGFDARPAPSAVVQASADSVADIDVVGVPGSVPGELPGPGSNVVVVARRPGRIGVTVTAAGGSSNVEAKFTLDLLGAARVEERRVPALSTGAAPQGPVAVPQGSVLVAAAAHVARRGDVVADDDGWIGGPRTPSAVEGIELRCSGADVGIAAQYMNSLDRGRWSTWSAPGTFVGTRQKASFLTGLRLKLVGTDAWRFELAVEALFLGSPVVVERGTELEIASRGGSDPLVGLRVAVAARHAMPAEAEERKPSRVRVFR